MQEILVNLDNASTGDGVLAAFGRDLQFGGPTTEVDAGITRPGQRNGWGLNWDALNDCLSCLDTGGIWGTSEKFEFPLSLVIKGHRSFKEACPIEFKMLVEILEETRTLYADDGKSFEYHFES